MRSENGAGQLPDIAGLNFYRFNDLICQYQFADTEIYAPPSTPNGSTTKLLEDPLDAAAFTRGRGVVTINGNDSDIAIC